MSLYSQSQRSLSENKTQVTKEYKRNVKDLYVRAFKQQQAQALESEDTDPQIEYQNLELFYDKLVEFANENFIPSRQFSESSENMIDDQQSSV